MAKTHTQTELARVLGITQGRVSQYIRQGVFNREDHWLIAIRKIYQHQAAQLAMRKGNNGADLIAERARLSKVQAEKIEIENARARLELLPLDVVRQVNEFHATTVRARLLGVPNRLKAKHSNLPTDAYLSLKEIVTEVLAELSRVRLPDDVDAETKSFFRNLHTAAQSNGDAVGG